MEMGYLVFEFFDTSMEKLDELFYFVMVFAFEFSKIVDQFPTYLLIAHININPIN